MKNLLPYRVLLVSLMLAACQYSLLAQGFQGYYMPSEATGKLVGGHEQAEYESLSPSTFSAIQHTSNKRKSRSKVWDHLSAGLNFDVSRSGQSLGPIVSYRLGDHISLSAQASISNMSFPQLMCLVTSIDTLALVRGSQFYFGDDHREANLIVRDRNEFSIGSDIGIGSKVRFTSSLRVGLRTIRVFAEVDEEITPEAARRQTIFGCGDFFIGTPKYGGPQNLQEPTIFESSATTGFVLFGSGLETQLLKTLRAGVQLLLKQNLYGNTRFRIRDTRLPGMGSDILKLSDHAPISQWRIQFRILAPLFP